MLCDNCKEREAIINLTQVEHDSKVTLHLCEQCAQQKGVETGVAIMKSPLGNFLGALGKGGALVPAGAEGMRCPACGSTLRDYADANGESGAFQKLHRVYDRAGIPCPICKTPIRRIVLGGRSTHFCPVCQRRRK